MIIDRRQGQVLVRLGNGDGTFLGIVHIRRGALVEPGSVVVADLNADGVEDVALLANIGTKPGVLTALGRGDGEFSAGGSYDLKAPALRLFVADFNLDGREDLATLTGAGFDAVS